MTNKKIFLQTTPIYGRLAAALLSIGCAVLLLSCGGSKQKEDEAVPETLMTQRAEELIIVESKQGQKKYRFEAPLVEGYDYAKEPYKEFGKGIKVETYTDSTEMIESTLVADYAIFFEKRELWEAKGNVVVTNAQGHILETQQLFWNQRTAKIYSNIDSKITQGDDVVVGVGFESDEAFKEWEFRKPRGKVTVEVDMDDSDSDAAVAKEPVKPKEGKRANIDTSKDRAKSEINSSSSDSGREVAPTVSEDRGSGRDPSMLRMDSIRASRRQSVDTTSNKSIELGR